MSNQDTVRSKSKWTAGMALTVLVLGAGAFIHALDWRDVTFKLGIMPSAIHSLGVVRYVYTASAAWIAAHITVVSASLGVGVLRLGRFPLGALTLASVWALFFVACHVALTALGP